MDVIKADRIWREALELIEQRLWPEAEGLLLYLIQSSVADQISIRDALGYVQLEQGDYRSCLSTLEPLLDHPDRHFWIAHKAADCWRGLGSYDRAVLLYEQSIREGSDSFLTFRNLLQVLDESSVEERMVLWSARFGSALEAAWVLGAQAAAMNVPQWRIGSWLVEQGLADAAVRRRHLQHQIYELNFSRLELLADCSDSMGRSLLERLRRFQLTP